LEIATYLGQLEQLEICFWILVSGCWILAAGYWTLVACYLAFVI